MVELRAAEERGEAEVGDPAAFRSFRGVGVRGDEDAVDLGAAGEDAVAGFADEDPDLGVGEFLLRGDDGGREQEGVADVAEFDIEEAHRGPRGS
jgi:hypothetical protein